MSKRGWTDHPLFWPLAVGFGPVISILFGPFVLAWFGITGDLAASICTIAYMSTAIVIIWMQILKPWRRMHRRIARWVVDGMETASGKDAWYMTGPSRGQWKNLCCNGFRPLAISWQDVYNQWPSDSLIKTMSQKDIDRNTNMIKLTLFEGYAKPVVAWCEENLQNPYYAWAERQEFCLMIPDEGDRMLWQLTWGDRLPEVRDIQQAVEKYEEFSGKNLVDGA